MNYEKVYLIVDSLETTDIFENIKLHFSSHYLLEPIIKKSTELVEEEFFKY